MYRSNAVIKTKLAELGFHQFYLFPHSRFMKDYHFQNMPFDALGWKKGEKCIYLFQFKTNCKPSKQILSEYKKIENEYYVKCLWVTKFDRKGVEVFCNDYKVTNVEPKSI